MSGHAYWMDDCSIEVPEGYRDRTSHTLEWKTPEGDALALIVQRDLLPPGERPDLQKYVASQTGDYAARFAGFSLERDDASSSDSAFPMRRKAFRWHKDHEVFYHHQAFVLAADRIVVLTAAAKAAHRGAVDALLEDALSTFAARGA
jgi:hypothetical protein